jgi:DNA modification methylase
VIDGHMRADLDPDQILPTLILDVTEEEAEKILLTHDPLGAMAITDANLLHALTKSVDFKDPIIMKMLADLQKKSGPVAGEITEDEVPLPPDEATTLLGDIWVLGNHRLMCGDSSKPAELDLLLAGTPIQLINSDPPYNVKVEPRSNNAIAAGNSSFQSTTHHQSLDLARHPGKNKGTTKQMRAKDRPLANDFVTDAEFDRLLMAWFGNMSRVLVPGRGFYIWGGYANCANYPPALKACQLYFSQAIIWVKEHPVLTRKDFMGNHEWCFYGWKEGAAHVFLGPKNVPDVWSVKKVNPQSMVHLTEKPVELAARAIKYSTHPGENVLDLFGGSGSTLMAAEQTERRAFLMELDPPYCDVILSRWTKFTGQKAVRLRDGATFDAAGGLRANTGKHATGDDPAV